MPGGLSVSLYRYDAQEPKIEQEQHTARVPAIAVTAFARSEDRQRALAAGFDEHLPKPVDPERLVRMLARIMRGGG